MSRGYLEVQGSLITRCGLMLSFAPPHMASPIVPPNPPCTHPHILADFKDRAQWWLTLSVGAHYHLPLAVNGFLSSAPCSVLAMGDCSRHREKRLFLWFIWLVGPGPQHQPPQHYWNCSPAWRHEPRRGQLYQSKLAGIIALKITLNLLLKDPRAWEMSGPVPCSEIC